MLAELADSDCMLNPQQRWPVHLDAPPRLIAVCVLKVRVERKGRGYDSPYSATVCCTREKQADKKSRRFLSFFPPPSVAVHSGRGTALSMSLFCCSAKLGALCYLSSLTSLNRIHAAYYRLKAVHSLRQILYCGQCAVPLCSQRCSFQLCPFRECSNVT